MADESGEVACPRPHTSVTYAVEDLPDDVALDGVDISNHSLQRAADHECQQQFASTVGGSNEDLATTRLTYTYFLPDQAGYDAGARWVRCDVIALETDTSLAQLPAKVTGLLDDDTKAARFEVCSQGEPGTSDSLLVMCTQDHDYSVLAPIRLGSRTSDFPGQSEVRDGGRDRCRSTAKDALDTEGGFTFTWTYPTEKDWADGRRFGFCWLAD